MLLSEEKKKRQRFQLLREFHRLPRGNFVNGAVGCTFPFLAVSKQALQGKAFYSLL